MAGGQKTSTIDRRPRSASRERDERRPGRPRAHAKQGAVLPRAAPAGAQQPHQQAAPVRGRVRLGRGRHESICRAQRAPAGPPGCAGRFAARRTRDGTWARHHAPRGMRRRQTRWQKGGARRRAPRAQRRACTRRRARGARASFSLADRHEGAHPPNSRAAGIMRARRGVRARAHVLLRRHGDGSCAENSRARACLARAGTARGRGGGHASRRAAVVPAQHRAHLRPASARRAEPRGDRKTTWKMMDSVRAPIVRNALRQHVPGGPKKKKSALLMTINACRGEKQKIRTASLFPGQNAYSCVPSDALPVPGLAAAFVV